MAHAAGGGSDFNSGTCGATAQVRGACKLQYTFNDNASLAKPFYSIFLLFKVVWWIIIVNS